MKVHKFLRLLSALLALSMLCQGQATSGPDCVPIEKMVDILTVTNEGSSPTQHTYRTTIGMQKSKTLTAGQQTSSTRSRDTESSSGSSSHSESTSGWNAGGGLSLGPLSASGGYSSSSTSGSSMQQSFSERIGQSSTSGFNWEAVDNNMFSEETTKEDTFPCDPRSRCVVTQLVGKYCNEQIKVPVFIIKRFPLVSPTLAPSLTGPNVDISIRRPGEVWILGKNLTFSNQSGVWETMQICDASSFVNGFEFKSSNWTGLTGFSLICSTRTLETEFKMVKEIQSGAGYEGSWYTPFRSRSKMGHAYGFVFQSWKRRDGSKFKGNWKLLLKGQKSHLFLPKNSHSVQTVEVKCPEKYAICGLQTMLDTTKSVISNIGFKCCYYCIPEQRLVDKDSFENRGEHQTSHTVTITEGTRGETGTSQGGQNGTDSSINSEGRNLAGVQEGFAAQFSSSSNKGFNWGSTSQSMWNSESSKTFNWICSPKSKCTVKQLVGICGEFQILTPHTVIESIPLDQKQDETNDNEEQTLESFLRNHL